MGKVYAEDLAYFSDENPVADLFDADFKPMKKQTQIFFDRMFCRKPVKEIAKEYRIPVAHVQAMIIHATKRVEKVLQLMDRHDITAGKGKRLEIFSRNVQVFLLHTLFEMQVNEIAKLLNVTHGAISRHLKKACERFDAGEIDLFKEIRGGLHESEAAQA